MRIISWGEREGGSLPAFALDVFATQRSFARLPQAQFRGVITTGSDKLAREITKT